MSRLGEIVVNCDTGNCYAQVIYRCSEMAGVPLDDCLSDDGWKRSGDRDRCPACVKDNYEPPDVEGEAFRGGETSAFQRDEQAHIQRELKR